MTRVRDFYWCSQCLRPVFLTRPPAVVDEDGDTVIDLGVNIAALRLHLRVGCDAA